MLQSLAVVWQVMKSVTERGHCSVTEIPEIFCQYLDYQVLKNTLFVGCSCAMPPSQYSLLVMALLFHFLA